MDGTKTQWERLAQHLAGICRYCQRRITPPRHGPLARVCKRKACQQASARERQRRHRRKA